MRLMCAFGRARRAYSLGASHHLEVYLSPPRTISLRLMRWIRRAKIYGSSATKFKVAQMNFEILIHHVKLTSSMSMSIETISISRIGR